MAFDAPTVTVQQPWSCARAGSAVPARCETTWPGARPCPGIDPAFPLVPGVAGRVLDLATEVSLNGHGTMATVPKNEAVRLLLLCPAIVIAAIQGRRLRRAGQQLPLPTYGVGGMNQRPPSAWWWDGTAGRFRPPDGIPHPANPPRPPNSVASPRPRVVVTLFALFWTATLVTLGLILFVDGANPVVLAIPYLALALMFGAAVLLGRGAE